MSSVTRWLPLVLGLVGCTGSVHQVAMGGLEKMPPPGAGVRRVEAEGKQFVVLYMTGNTDYADEAYRKLVAQCPNGELYAIEARYSTSHGFLSYTNHLRATALCVEQLAPRPAEPRAAL